MRLKSLLPAGLALGVVFASIAGSACFTAGVISDSTHPTQASHVPALRVRHCYLSPKNQLLVLAEGGAWQANSAATPKDQISFALELNQLDTQSGAGVIALPQSILHAGWPDAQFLQQNGYREIVFAEQVGFRKPTDPDQRARQAAAQLVVRYLSSIKWSRPAGASDDYLGLQPAFTLQNIPGLQNRSFSVVDNVQEGHLGQLLLVPLTVPLDIVTSPLQLLFLMTYRGG